MPNIQVYVECRPSSVQACTANFGEQSVSIVCTERGADSSLTLMEEGNGVMSLETSETEEA